MGGCQSFDGTEVDASAKKVEFSDIAGHKAKNNNTKVAPSLEQKPYLQPGYASERIGQMDIRSLSALPHGFDKAEWMASNTIAFFKHINLLSSALSEFCTTASCPTACGPGERTYHWMDEHGKKVRCSAPLYTDYTMSYIQDLLTDEQVFPTRTGSAFPPGYIFLVQKIFQFLFRTLAHLYWAHFRDVARMEMHAHLNTLFIHLVTFSQEFGLLDPTETAPLEDLISVLVQYHRA